MKYVHKTSKRTHSGAAMNCNPRCECYLKKKKMPSQQHFFFILAKHKKRSRIISNSLDFRD